MAIKARIFRLVVLLFIFFSLFSSSQALGRDLDVEGADRLSDSEMNALRGRYTELYFTVEFSGSWTPNGVQTELTVDGNVDVTDAAEGSNSPSLDNPEIVAGVSSGGEDVEIKAIVGDLNGAQGAMQISLVPGNNNDVMNTMNIYLTVINVTDPSQIPEITEFLFPDY